MRKLTLLAAIVVLVRLNGGAEAQDEAEEGTRPCLDDLQDRAVAECTALIQVAKPGDPFLPSYLTARAGAYEENGDLYQALMDRDRVIALEPEESEGYRDRAILHVERREFTAALRDMDMVVKLHPDVPMSYASRGWAYTAAGSYDAAMIDLDRAIDMDPRHAWWPRLTRSRVLLTQGRTDDALAELDRAAALSSGSPVGRERGVAELVKSGGLPVPDSAFETMAATPSPDATTRLWSLVAAPFPWSDKQRKRTLASYSDDSDNNGWLNSVDEWPRPILDLYAGRRSESDVMHAAERSAVKRDDRRCQAAFFAGMLDWRQANLPAARRNLSASLQLCRQSSWEGLVAKAAASNL